MRERHYVPEDRSFLEVGGSPMFLNMLRLTLRKLGNTVEKEVLKVGFVCKMMEQNTTTTNSY
jgi:hypothetical protein